MMYLDFFYITQTIRQWIEDEDGVAMVEAVMLFPPMLTLLLGVYDLGNGIILSQKTITASQVAADLISRNKTMNTPNLADIIEGSKLAYEPYGTNAYGVDIVSVQFDSNQNPQILWRETQNMPPNDNAVASVKGLSASGDGMIIVTVVYKYVPQFAGVFTGEFDFSEVAFSRGRRSATVTWD
jgi:Flp pilus assembly protein TadG